MNLSLQQLRDLAVAHGFPDPDTAAAVAMAESDGNARARGDLTLGFSLGLWQVNLQWHPEYRGDDPDGSLGTNALYDPDTNAKAAFAISNGGHNWNPWSTFKSGAYKRFMPTVTSSSSDAALDACVIALVVAAFAYAKRRKLKLPAYGG